MRLELLKHEANLHFLANFFFRCLFGFLPTHPPTCGCSRWALQGSGSKAVYRTFQLISFRRESLLPRADPPLSVLIVISLLLLTLVCPSHHNDLCHSGLRSAVTWLHFETQSVLLWLFKCLGKRSWLWGRKKSGMGCPFSGDSTFHCLDSKFYRFFWMF